MSIRFTFRSRCFEISIGHKAPWFCQVWLVSVTELWFDNYEVDYAELILGWPKR